jgi:predicted HicB family RNase H-like nuclease
MNLTLAVDDRLVEQARKVAESQGKSLNQVIREYLESDGTQNRGSGDRQPFV